VTGGPTPTPGPTPTRTPGPTRTPTPTPEVTPTVVVGAGISGAACAGALAANGAPVLVLDRGQRPGGRMAVRTLRGTGTDWDGHAVDLGASYLTAHDPGFRAVVDDWVDRGLARPWTDTFHLGGPEGLRGTTTGPIRYAARDGLRSLVEDLLDRMPDELVQVQRPVDVTSGTLTDTGVAVDGRSADAAALCMPDPQARRLLDPTVPALEPTRLATEGVLWEPVIVLVAVYRRRCWPEVDGVFVNDDPVLTWIADDGRRRGDDAPVLVAHADPVLSAGHLADPEVAAPAMLATLRRVLGTTDDPAWVEVKRWSFARPVASWPQPFHLDKDARIGLAGDGWHAGPKVESAWSSGHALGHAMAALG
jgi:renalase